jgi:DNA repair exonuclease SbcCD ATPase subunit
VNVVDPKEGNPTVDPANTEATDNQEEQVDWRAQAEELKSKLESTDASLEALKKESDRNIRRMQSSYTQTINQLSARSEEERARLEEQYDAQKMSTMEEGEALRYKNARLAERLEQEAARRAELQERAQDATAKSSYIAQFANLGVPITVLNTNGSLQDLADSGWGALADIRAQERNATVQQAERIKEIEKLLEEARAPITDPGKLGESLGDQRPPNVATHTPGDVVGSKNMFEVQKSLESYFGHVPTEEEVYRAVETGKLSPTVLPGVDQLRPE